jgi:hypothetical protein
MIFKNHKFQFFFITLKSIELFFSFSNEVILPALIFDARTVSHRFLDSGTLFEIVSGDTFEEGPW